MKNLFSKSASTYKYVGHETFILRDRIQLFDLSSYELIVKNLLSIALTFVSFFLHLIRLRKIYKFQLKSYKKLMKITVPLAVSAFTTSMFPPITALCNGVRQRRELRPFTFAPSKISDLTIFVWPK